MQQIQITRGKLEIRANHKALLNGELFLDYTHGKKYDEKNLTYELFAGCNGEAIKIGGQGVLSFIRALDENEGLPTNPIKGGIYYVTNDIQLGDGHNTVSGNDVPEFRKGDLAIYVGEDLHRDTLPLPIDNLFNRASGTFPELAPGWIRVNNGGGAAYEVVFDPTNTNFSPETTNVQAALVELDRHKLAFGGIKFKKAITVGEKDLVGGSVLATGENNFEITAAELLATYGIKAGHYYSVGELAANTSINVVVSETESIKLEEGDFLAVISDLTTNGSPLGISDLKFVKIAGGTHDSARINYTPAGERNETYQNSGDKAWEDADASVQNVKQALDVLFQSKADLNSHGKIPLTQLPDTLIQSMEFAGSFVLGPDEEFRLPTDADKSPNGHEDESTEGNKLVQGDYFIYTGKSVDLSKVDASIADNVRSSEGFITSGDWLVFEGNDKWSVIDNTSPIQSIRVIDNFTKDEDDVINQSTIHELQGEIKFQGAERGDTGISETQLEADDKQTVTVHNENSALIGNDDKGQRGVIYKERDGNKTLTKSGVYETDDGQLVFDEKRGLELKGEIKAAVSVVSKDSNNENNGQVEVDDILHADIIQNPAQKDFGNIELKLPSQSGTIARLEDVGLKDGSDFYIPRYKENETTHEITLVDSPIELVDHIGNVGESPNLAGFKFHKAIGEAGLQKDNSVIFRGNNDSEDELIHVMPGTSGYILNSNSIIDCGEWTDNGIVYEHEGDFNTYHNATISTISETYRDLIISNDKLDINAKEIIDAYITDGN